MRCIILVIIIFMMVFSFKIPALYNSSIFATSLLIIPVIKSATVRDNFFTLINTKSFVSILSGYIFFMFFACLNTTMQGEFDYTILGTLVNNLVSIFGVALLCSIMLRYNGRKIEFYLVSILIAQSFLIFIMMFVPSFKEFIYSFSRTDFQLERMSVYGGVRGLGLAGFVAFGLAIVMGLLGVVLHYWFRYQAYNMRSFYKFCIFMICLAGALSAGRTSVLGFLIGFIFYFNLNAGVLIRGLFKYTIYMALMSVLIVILYFVNDSFAALSTKYSIYVFQFIWNYVNDGSANVQSLQVLSSMYFYPPSDSLIFGDGLYSSGDGYYLDTDAGYMRYLLYVGLVGSLLIYMIFLISCYYSYLSVRNEMIAAKKFMLIFILVSVLYHYKGEVILLNVAYAKVFLMMIFYYSLSSKLKVQSGLCDIYSNLKQ